jgi:hypothetical protein
MPNEQGHRSADSARDLPASIGFDLPTISAVKRFRDASPSFDCSLEVFLPRAATSHRHHSFKHSPKSLQFLSRRGLVSLPLLALLHSKGCLGSCMQSLQYRPSDLQAETGIVK